MSARFVSDTLDLSNLPAPQVVQTVSYEAILADRLARLKTLWPDLDTTGLETEPGVILQQEDAYREALDLQAINDAAKAVMLAFATGADLDNLAAFYGVARLTITPANPATSTPAAMESDADLRTRTQLAPEALPYAGMTGGGYRSLALKTAPSVADVTTLKRPGGRVDVILLSRTGNGAVPDDVVTTVYQAFQDDEATQLTDVVSVRSAEIVNYSVSLKLRIPRGPDPSFVQAAAELAAWTYAASRHKVGLPVYLAGFVAAGQLGSVEQAIVLSPGADVIPPNDGAAFCTGITVTTEIVS